MRGVDGIAPNGPVMTHARRILAAWGAGIGNPVSLRGLRERAS